MRFNSAFKGLIEWFCRTWCVVVLWADTGISKDPATSAFKNEAVFILRNLLPPTSCLSLCAQLQDELPNSAQHGKAALRNI
jgi:hypothetical protein